MSLQVEWDEAKREANILTRGVGFVRAADIFYGAVVEAEDVRADYGERRFRALGKVDGQSFIVVYTWRGERRRIISAWEVGHDGRRRYQNLFPG